MTLDQATELLEGLETETNKKSKHKIYREFLQIIKALKKRSFSETELQSIEQQLERLNLQSNEKKKTRSIAIALRNFKKFLKDRFSLITAGYFTNLGVGLGCTVGILFAIVFLSRFERSVGIALGIGIGMILGLLYGRSLDTKAKNEGRIL